MSAPARSAGRRIALGAMAALALGLGLGLTVSHRSMPRPAERLETARDLILARKPEAALAELRRALAELGDAGPDELRLKVLLRAAQVADLHLERGPVGEALAFYRRVTEEFPHTPEAFDAAVRMAEIYRQRLEDDRAAEQHLARVVERFPAQPGVERLLVRASRIALENRRYDQARDHAERLLQVYDHSPHAAEAQTLIAQSFHLEGNHREATAAFEEVAERWPGTPEAARALFEAGNCLGEQGEFGRALARYIESLPEHPDPMSVQRALDRARGKLSALQAMSPGSRAVAFGPR